MTAADTGSGMAAGDRHTDDAATRRLKRSAAYLRNPAGVRAETVQVRFRQLFDDRYVRGRRAQGSCDLLQCLPLPLDVDRIQRGAVSFGHAHEPAFHDPRTTSVGEFRSRAFRGFKAESAAEGSLPPDGAPA